MHLEQRHGAAIFPRSVLALSVGTLLCLMLLSGCSREETPEEEDTAPPPAMKPGRALAHSVSMSATRGFAALTAAAQATIDVVEGGTRVTAAGEDPQLTFGVTGAVGRPTAVYVDFESPAASVLELFYQVGNVPFSADHVITTATKAGRNEILLQVDDPRFSGWCRLDPGQAAGEYTVRSIIIFSDRPIGLIAPARPQTELAAAFEASTTSLFAARTAEVFSAFQALKDVKLDVVPEGLSVHATGTDPSLILPEFAIAQPAIIKVVIASPAETTLQIFHKVHGQTDYTEPQSRSQRIAAGENVIYIEHDEPTTAGPMRLDPGNVPGDYLIKEIEVRAVVGESE